jgi:hypothetical protein
MMNVEQIHPGFQWAEPLQEKELHVERTASDLVITGLVPRYDVQDSPSDLIHQFEKTPRQILTGQQGAGTQSPEIAFGNADTDEKLIAFVRRFGPVVARCVEDTRLIADKELGEPRRPGRLIAHQDMQELRNERAIYRAALDLVMQMGEPEFDFDLGQQAIKIIAAGIEDWPRQWEREKSQRQWVPMWKLSSESLKSIKQLSSARPDPILPPVVGGRIVICELLNSFPSIVFPSLLEMHSNIKYGIRHLLYSILRCQFIYPRSFAACANTQCRNFFNIDRAGQQFCCPDCSIHHRQRVYWEQRGKKLRKKRSTTRRKKTK